MIRFRRDEQRVVGQELARGRHHDLCDMHHAFVRGALTWTVERIIRISRKAVNTDVVAIAAKLDLPPSPDDLARRFRISRNVICNSSARRSRRFGLSLRSASAAAVPDHVPIPVKRYDLNWLESARLWVALIGNPEHQKDADHAARTGWYLQFA
jgi:hypothetical protein